MVDILEKHAANHTLTELTLNTATCIQQTDTNTIIHT